MSDQRMLDRFARLCEIPSPTGAERAVADAVLAELRELGVDAARGRRGRVRRAPGAGNLIARVPGAGTAGYVLRPPRHGSPRRADRGRLADGVFRSRGRDDPRGRQQGGGDRADGARGARSAGRPRPSGSSSSSPSPRRTACAAPRSSTSARFARRYGFVLDHASPIGEVIVAAPTYKRLHAEFDGRRGARGDPPRGRAQRDRGRRRGGRGDEARPPRRRDDGQRRRDRGRHAPRTSSPGRCRVDGEARSLDDEARRRGDRGDGRRVHLGGGRARLRRRRRGARDVPRLPARAERRAGRRGRARGARALRATSRAEIATGGGSDANALIAARLRVRAARQRHRGEPHRRGERRGGAIVEMLDVCEAIARAGARARC